MIKSTGKERILEEAIFNDFIRQLLPVKNIMDDLPKDRAENPIKLFTHFGVGMKIYEVPLTPSTLAEKMKGFTSLQKSNESPLKELKQSFNAFNKNCYTFRLHLTEEVVYYRDLEALLTIVSTFMDFGEDNDPYGLHDFAAFEVDPVVAISFLSSTFLRIEPASSV